MKSVAGFTRVAVLVAIVCVAMFGPTVFSAPQEQQESELRRTRVYNVSDLPVWRHGGRKGPEFDPTVLTAYIERTISPGSWQDAIHPHAKTASLVISQTPSNHE